MTRSAMASAEKWIRRRDRSRQAVTKSTSMTRSDLQPRFDAMNEWTFIRHPDATWSWLNVQSDHVSGSFYHFGSL